MILIDRLLVVVFELRFQIMNWWRPVQTNIRLWKHCDSEWFSCNNILSININSQSKTITFSSSLCYFFCFFFLPFEIRESSNSTVFFHNCAHTHIQTYKQTESLSIQMEECLRCREGRCERKNDHNTTLKVKQVNTESWSILFSAAKLRKRRPPWSKWVTVVF